MAQITLNEGLAWLKTLKKRHEELIALRDGNAHRERRFYGATADKEIVKEPVYDVRLLDKAVANFSASTIILAVTVWVDQGMAIFVPPGDIADPTRAPSFYDETYEYLTSLGVPPA